MGRTHTHIWDRHTYGIDTHMGQTHMWDRHTDRHTYGTDTHMKNSPHAKKNFVCGRISAQIVLKHLPWPGDSKSVLRFEIE